MVYLHELEAGILLFLQSIRQDFLSAFLVPLTYACEHGEVWLVLSLVLLCFRRTRKAGALALLSMLLCWGSSELLVKILVQRQRPFTVIEGLVPAVAPPRSFSFPSGHSCCSLSAAGTHWRVLKNRPLRWGILVVALLIAFSRLYLGVHYPTDVLVGSLWGWFGSDLVVRFFSPRWDLWVEQRAKKKGEIEEE
jgi:undecaprenyl-diphosphatase